MILPIYTYGQAVLRKQTEEITADYPNLQELIANMCETMYSAQGVGLAAPQIGHAIRLFVVDGTPMADEYDECIDFKRVVINPEVIEESEEENGHEEGCLSVPGVNESVMRANRIVVNYLDEHFVEHTETLTGFAARIFLHEYDHLEGKVFTDRISPIRRQFIKTKLTNIAKGKATCGYKTKH